MNRVVVTGLGILSPVGHTIEEYWNHLIQGVCGIDYITRFDTTDLPFKIAGEVKNFHPEDVLSKSERKSSDRCTQYAVYSAIQAYIDSNLSEIDPERLGVYYGSGIGGIQSMEAEYENYRLHGTRLVSPYYIPKIITNSPAGLIAIKCQAKGPCLPVVTACATSSHAIGEAYKAVLHGDADAIIAGGCDAGITPSVLAGFANCGALSLKQEPEQASIPYDRRRDGFVMGEGAAAIILESYESAKRRGAKIYAEMVGYGNTCDAYHITASDPEVKGCSKAMKICMEAVEPSWKAEEIYINTHGTSTMQNDRNETKAIKNVFGDRAYEINLSSTKSMTGHMMGAGGAAEAIATILALRDGKIPPTIGLNERDSECDLNYTPNVSIHKRIQLGLSISMGFGGHNACLAFQPWNQ